MYERKNEEFWRGEIAANTGNTKGPWRTMQGRITNETSLHNADDFATFLKNKVDSVRDSTSDTPAYEVPWRPAVSTLVSWTEVTVDDRFSAEQDVSTRSCSHLVSEGVARTPGALHHCAVQQAASRRNLSRP